MAQKSGKHAVPNVELLVKYMADVNSSLAVLQKKTDDLKSVMEEKFAEQTTLREDDARAANARIASMGNQVSYFRETVCESLKDIVSTLRSPS